MSPSYIPQRASLAVAVYFCLLVSLVSPVVQAAQMRVSPVLVDVLAPASSATISISNTGETPLTVQVRLFGWQQQEGNDAYLRTKAVAASPPIVELPPGKVSVVRIVRLAETPPQGQESYRLIIDQLPSVTPDDSVVALLIRHSIPVFFTGAQSTKGEVSWGIEQRQGENQGENQGQNQGKSQGENQREVQLNAVNHGDGYIKLSALTLSDAQGNRLSFGDGLVGYILGHSSRSFVRTTEQHLTGPQVQLNANSNIGKIETIVPVPK